MRADNTFSILIPQISVNPHSQPSPSPCLHTFISISERKSTHKLKININCSVLLKNETSNHWRKYRQLGSLNYSEALHPELFNPMHYNIFISFTNNFLLYSIINFILFFYLFCILHFQQEIYQKFQTKQFQTSKTDVSCIITFSKDKN